ncbi:cyclopropane-fatty-acyl-phospholipid synthase family protein [Pseudorhodoferax sp. Leaf274]|uniref:SAM-dependent methyltransferase n=1 Tax=Pseudorhodoferax sp. Leaf274 TaxID=1736318 RepID=UPI000702577F|nr:cyclopropane-fatty-acyl-phospholipid synthase family protein [Pseudorhodoferax sp. Leaf274]KQP35293.1 cyclopropane-fatty-acyl-phospholipid synthase [Pseudorhodoferax sp. Leaf274]
MTHNPELSSAIALRWAEQGRLPDRVVRSGIRHLLRQRLAELHSGNAEAGARIAQDFLGQMRAAELAPLPEKANEQHYELPAAFFAGVLGPHRKYSSCHWAPGVQRLEDAEAAALAATCERAGLQDGQRVLELGCGWGSLSLWMAERYPNSWITALSNSHSQRAYIEAQALARGLSNLRVLTRDINAFDTDERFDRVVSVEMFEHLRNWPRAFAQVARWLVPGGRFFMHVFAHREAPYAFEPRDESDWMSRHFFSGGMMPSDDLALQCQDDLRLLERWRWDGRHYQRTAAAWLANMDAGQATLLPLLASTYGEDHAGIWWQRWRLFFMAVEELFGYADGQQWWVSHYLFERRAA